MARATAAIGALLLVASPSLSAQVTAPSGVVAGAFALTPDAALGGGSPTGPSLALVLGTTERLSIELGVGRATGITDGDLRRYTLLLPSALMRARLLGEETSFDLLLGGGALRASLAASGGLPAETRTLPALFAGAGLRVHVAGPIYADLSGGDWMTLARAGEFSATPAERKLRHTPEIRIGLAALFRHKGTTVSNFEDLPISYTQDFRPVDAAAVDRPPTSVTVGRDHLHVDEGTAVGVRAIPADEFDGTSAPSSASILAPVGPVAVYTEDKVGSVYFALGLADVAPTYRVLLGDVARYLKQNPEVQLRLIAFSDPTGNVKGNESLAERRGTALFELLARVYGISQSRMTVTSIGPDFTAGTTAQARRVDLVTKSPRGSVQQLKP